MSNYTTLSPEQQQYTQISATSKTLYKARKFSMELQDAALSPGSDPLVIAQRANELGRMIEAGANQLYAVKMSIEQQHPHFKTDAINYAKAQQQEQKHEQTVQQEHGI